MIILDTNVISALMQSTPETKVVDWLNAQPSESIWTISICIFEVLFGLNSMADGRRRKALREAFEIAVHQDLAGRVLDFDTTTASESAAIAAKLKAEGRPVEIRDVQIAGIVAARHGTLATRNTKHFIDTGVSIINPWESK